MVKSIVFGSRGSTGSGGDAQGDMVSADFENLSGSGYGDVLKGNGLANLLIGQGGNDVITAGAGNDTLLGDFADPGSAPPQIGIFSTGMKHFCCDRNITDLADVRLSIHGRLDLPPGVTETPSST